MLRKKGVVGKVRRVLRRRRGRAEPGRSRDHRATWRRNMARPSACSPSIDQTLDYLRMTNRSAGTRSRWWKRTPRSRACSALADAPEPVYSDTLALDLATVVPSLAGPKRPQDRINLPDVKKNFLDALERGAEDGRSRHQWRIERPPIQDGSVVIAAITSCTNTSNPSVMIAAGLLAKKAVEHGLKSKPWVKTSLAPGSKVVIDYLNDAGLMPYLEELKFNLVGYGCTTCIGNSGPLPDDVAAAVQKEKADRRRGALAAIAISKAASIRWCARTIWRRRRWWSPTRSRAASTSIWRTSRSARTPPASDVFLRDIWPTPEEVQAVVKRSVRAEMFAERILGSLRRATSSGTRSRSRRAICTRGTTSPPTSSKPPYFDEMVDPATFGAGSRRPARARGAGRFGHHRSHFAGRQYRRR